MPWVDYTRDPQAYDPPQLEPEHPRVAQPEEPELPSSGVDLVAPSLSGKRK